MPIFVHIPKTGGMTVNMAPELRGGIMRCNREMMAPEAAAAIDKKMLSDGYRWTCYGHARWRDILPEFTSHQRAVAIVRNPWSRVVSRFLYSKTQKGGNRFPEEFSLGDFLELRHKYGDREYYWHYPVNGWYPQVDYVTDTDGALRCDILRFEKFSEDVPRYFRTGCQLKKIRNVSNGYSTGEQIINIRDYREFYTEEQKQIVADWYRQDIEFFGFTFDGPATKNIWA